MNACITLDLSRLSTLDAIMCLETLPELSLHLIEDVIIRIPECDQHHNSLRVERAVAEKLQLRRLVYIIEPSRWFGEKGSEEIDLKGLCDFSSWAEQLPFHSLVLRGHIKEGCLYITCNTQLKRPGQILWRLRGYQDSMSTAGFGFAWLRLCRRFFSSIESVSRSGGMDYHVWRTIFPHSKVWVLTVSKM